MNSNKIIFIEWDGATWEVIDRLMSKGKLPHLKKLMRDGMSTTLISEHPYVSARIWTSIYSGKRPSKHGVEFFGATSRDVRCKRVWDIAEKQGLKIGVLGTLVTWPPRVVNGYMVPCVFALGPECHPSELQFLQELILGERKQKEQTVTKLRRAVTYARKLHAHGGTWQSFIAIILYLAWEKLNRPKFLDRYWRKASIHLWLTADVFTHLYSEARPDLATFHIHLCDAVSHRYWAFWEPDKFNGVPEKFVKRFHHVIPRAYQEADRVIGKIADGVDSGTTIIVASDHGFGALSNRILPYTLRPEEVLKLLGIESGVLPAKIGVSTFFYFEDAALKRRIKDELQDVGLAGSEIRLFLVKEKENYLEVAVKWELLRGQVSEDSIVEFPHFGKHGFGELFSKAGPDISGVHQEKGILVLAGPSVKEGAQLDSASIYDLAPTMLALLGLPVAQDMDGRVLTEALTEDFLRDHPISSVPTYEIDGPVASSEEASDYDKIKERLRSLGYL